MVDLTDHSDRLWPPLPSAMNAAHAIEAEAVVVEHILGWLQAIALLLHGAITVVSSTSFGVMYGSS
ncbi:putative membrane protein (plasmid) [Rhodococcus opacus]|uniref:Putative membrane protein n=1 Tax=Rhodococcus opacus TaxID=37919 RepID=A0A1B1KGZ9_RHOOP|nr:putative membrane protein [Rhodococcus opacus]